jgi:hypothetical protein
MDHPARRLRFRFVAVLAPVVFVVVLPVLVASAVQMFVASHIGSPFPGKLLQRREMCTAGDGGRIPATAPTW